MIRFEVSPATAAVLVVGLVAMPTFMATLIWCAHRFGVCQ